MNMSIEHAQRPAEVDFAAIREGVSDALSDLARAFRTLKDSFTLPALPPERSAFAPDAVGAHAFNQSRMIYDRRRHDVEHLEIFGVHPERRKKAVLKAKEIAQASKKKAVATAHGSKEVALGLFGRWYSPGWLIALLLVAGGAYINHKFRSDVPSHIRERFQYTYSGPPSVSEERSGLTQ